MKKLLMVGAIMVGAVSASQAGINISISLPLPPLPSVVFCPPPPVCLPRVVMAPPVCVPPPPPVCAPRVIVTCPPVVYRYDYRGHGHGYDRHDNRGYGYRR